MQGKRLSTQGDGKFPDDIQPGDYWLGANGVWWICAPSNEIGHISQHKVTEHEDGTITVSPSILITGGRAWHGMLEHGVWREL